MIFRSLGVEGFVPPLGFEISGRFIGIVNADDVPYALALYISAVVEVPALALVKVNSNIAWFLITVADRKLFKSKRAK